MFEKHKYLTAAMSVTGSFKRFIGSVCDQRAHQLLIEGPCITYGVGLLKRHDVDKYLAVSTVAALLAESLEGTLPKEVIRDLRWAIQFGILKRNPEWNTNASHYMHHAASLSKDFTEGVMQRWGEEEEGFFNKLKRCTDEGGFELSHPLERTSASASADAPLLIQSALAYEKNGDNLSAYLLFSQAEKLGSNYAKQHIKRVRPRLTDTQTASAKDEDDGERINNLLKKTPIS